MLTCTCISRGILWHISRHFALVSVPNQLLGTCRLFTLLMKIMTSGNGVVTVRGIFVTHIVGK